MGDSKKAHGKLKASEWAVKAASDNEAELEKLAKPAQNRASNNPSLDAKQKLDIAKLAGQKAVAAAKKDSNDLLDLLVKLDEDQNPGRDKKVDAAAAKATIAKIIVIGRKHSVPEAAIRQALKNSGYQA